MASNAPRIMIAGTGSGCGKTTVTLAVLRAMQRRKIPLAAFKCGPDYIDPMFHKAVLGIPSRNLDLFFISEREVRGQIVRNALTEGKKDTTIFFRADKTVAFSGSYAFGVS